jgi:hypothetical protein
MAGSLRRHGPGHFRFSCCLRDPWRGLRAAIHKKRRTWRTVRLNFWTQRVQKSQRRGKRYANNQHVETFDSEQRSRWNDRMLPGYTFFCKHRFTCFTTQVGQQVAVKILSIDEMKRVHLSISQVFPGFPSCCSSDLLRGSTHGMNQRWYQNRRMQDVPVWQVRFGVCSQGKTANTILPCKNCKTNDLKGTGVLVYKGITWY